MEAIWSLELVREVSGGFFPNCSQGSSPLPHSTLSSPPINYHLPLNVMHTRAYYPMSRLHGGGPPQYEARGYGLEQPQVTVSDPPTNMATPLMLKINTYY